MSQNKRKQSKDIIANSELMKLGECSDQFIVALQKRMRNKKKKLEKIKETEDKIKNKEIEPN